MLDDNNEVELANYKISSAAITVPDILISIREFVAHCFNCLVCRFNIDI
jgi:hypothetical protein